MKQIYIASYSLYFRKYMRSKLKNAKKLAVLPRPPLPSGTFGRAMFCNYACPGLTSAMRGKSGSQLGKEDVDDFRANFCF